ncbi:hypothetical protein PSA01_68410 [Pseudonocardia saturnea]|uniref:Uncharacterized protein n=1 Tax=Pseudonocardia saturnea TaxID=33909 RepID=A0ABQ0SA78_9PSEU|nr:hypothetical protein PSA01_68410 [Pseudonocardia saturnea]
MQLACNYQRSATVTRRVCCPLFSQVGVEESQSGEAFQTGYAGSIPVARSTI